MRIKLILASHAGREKAEHYLPLIKSILDRENLLNISLPKFPGDALSLAQEAAQENYDILVAGGGDGTLNEVINGVLRVRSDLPLGFIPLGMSNTAAWGLGLSQDPIKACEIILKRKIKRIDLGKVTKPTLHYFISMADFGYSGALVRLGESKLKSTLLKVLFGKTLYRILGYPLLFRYDFPRMTVKIEDAQHEGYLIIVSNNGSYMGKFKIASQAKIDDGYLDVCIFKKAGILALHRYFYWGLLFNKLHAFPDVEFYRAKKISITSADKVPGQIDGEPFGFTPVEIEIAPQILHMILP